ncbi:NAD(P)/FAD-dependent oxidoreductase [Teichococcus vastitatis]|uniref:Thioredoxin reductase n=1 Tax=Teichococcus vastitatis TaxID=2307076 RepID=A0ABS9WAN3_9PROT|nr:NAD(P)/FAD-dependent oxidoreductase [Pseudoroseomonas vastitatis]MCI0755820.1 NAD(P)/FAD-dependent oxidoreductase [Pseudoroseomonas vastitatis]
MTGYSEDILDCLVIGGGPAGLTAALYLARFKRSFLVVDSGSPRANWIPTSHNIPFFAEGISGSTILKRQREHAERYGARIIEGLISDLQKQPGSFIATLETKINGKQQIRARRVLLATGAQDIEPAFPDLPDAVQRGLVRYCPICDGYEARDQKIAVIGHGAHGLGEAIFIARTYADDVTLLTLGKQMDLDQKQRERAIKYGIKVLESPVDTLEIQGDRITALRIDGAETGFDVLYSALGLRFRTELAFALGAQHDDTGALIVDDHNQTTVSGLYAAGAIVRGLDQIVVAMGHSAVAATHIHNQCELPTEEEPDGTEERKRGHSPLLA